MSKTLKDFLEGYLNVKSADEQKFVDKHVTAKNPDRNGNGDDVFKGSTKTIDRRKDRKGYNPGEDEKVYEELKGNQHKIDANKNGKLDAHDFKLLRSKKMKEESDDGLEAEMKAQRQTKKSVGGKWKSVSYKTADGKWASKDVKEEAEELDELSQTTVKSYMSSNRLKPKAGLEGDARNKSTTNRYTGYARARDKMKPAEMAGARVRATEEVEQIDELKKGDWVVHSGGKVGQVHNVSGDKSSVDVKWNKTSRVTSHEPNSLQKMKEEAEQIDEISATTKDSYAKKAVKQLPSLFNKSRKDAEAARTYYNRKNTVRKISNEETQIDELSKGTMGRYINKAKDQIDTVSWRQGYREAGAGNPSGALEKKLTKRHKGIETAVKKLTKEEAEQVDEVLTAKTPMGTYIKDFQKSKAPQFKGKSPAKRRVMAIAAKLSAERGGKPLTKEERLIGRLSDISESHQRTMLDVFEKLSEDNKTKFMEACVSPDGVNQMLDFAITYRGE